MREKQFLIIYFLEKTGLGSSETVFQSSA